MVNRDAEDESNEYASNAYESNRVTPAAGIEARPESPPDELPPCQPLGRTRSEPPAGPTQHDDVDDQFRSLLEGLRTSLPGVQVLFAFLLTAPFQGRFSELDAIERTAFSVAFYCAGLSSILLISPSVHQRLRAPISGMRRHSKVHLVIATWLTVVGTVVMGVSIIATVFLVSTVVFGTTTGAIATAVPGAAVIWGWFYLPLVTFNRLDQSATIADGLGASGDPRHH